MTKTILTWARKHPYLADHWFLYAFAWSAVVTGAFTIFEVIFGVDFPDTVADIPDPWRSGWALLTLIGGYMVARGVNGQKAKIEAAGLMLLATCTILAAISRLADADPVGVLMMGAGLGLGGRAILVVVLSSRTASKNSTRWRL
jgi:putative Mn2+ efflux pump MntP